MGKSKAHFRPGDWIRASDWMPYDRWCIFSKLPCRDCDTNGEGADIVGTHWPGNQILPSHINEVRARLKLRAECFYECPEEGMQLLHPWADLAEVMSRTKTIDIETGEISSSELVGDGAGLWTNIPARLSPTGEAIYGETLPDHARVLAEHFNEIVRVCENLCCGVGSPILLLYATCAIDPATAEYYWRFVLIMPPKKYRGNLLGQDHACLANIGGHLVEAFESSAAWVQMTVLEIEGNSRATVQALWGDGSLLTPSGIRVLNGYDDQGNPIYEIYRRYGAVTCEGAIRCGYATEVLVPKAEEPDWTEFYDCPGLKANTEDASFEFLWDVTEKNSDICQGSQPCKQWRYKRCDKSLSEPLQYVYAPQSQLDPPLVIRVDRYDAGFNNCFEKDIRVPCRSSNIPEIGESPQVVSCAYYLCTCCPNLNLDLMDRVNNGLKERAIWLNGGVTPAPWDDPTYILNQKANKAHEHCEGQINFWFAMAAEWDIQGPILLAAAPWVDIRTAPAAEIEGLASVPLASDNPLCVWVGDTHEVDPCENLAAWTINALNSLQLMIAVTVTGGQTETDFRNGGPVALETCEEAKTAAQNDWNAFLWMSFPGLKVTSYDYSNKTMGSIYWVYGANVTRIRGQLTADLSSYASGSASIYLLAGVPSGNLDPGHEGDIPGMGADSKFHFFATANPGGIYISDLLNSIDTPPGWTADCPSSGPYGTGFQINDVVAVVFGNFKWA